MQILIQMGCDIAVYEKNGKGYYLRERDFGINEIRLLMDSVFTNNTIPVRQTNTLIRKLQKLMSALWRKEYAILTFCRETAKTSNM